MVKSLINNIFKRVLILGFSVTLVSFAFALQMKMGIGNGAWVALCKTLSEILDVRIGLLSSFLNIVCIFIQILILRNQFKLIQILQFFVVVLYGWLLDYFYYCLFADLYINNYLIQFILFFIGILIAALGVALSLEECSISFPLESLCQVVSDKIRVSYGNIRRKLDGVCIVIAIFLSLLFDSNIQIREGTLLLFIVFGKSADFFKNMFRHKSLV